MKRENPYYIPEYQKGQSSTPSIVRLTSETLSREITPGIEAHLAGCAHVIVAVQLPTFLRPQKLITAPFLANSVPRFVCSFAHAVSVARCVFAISQLKLSLK